jgi:hypothetical protein
VPQDQRLISNRYSPKDIPSKKRKNYSNLQSLHNNKPLRHLKSIDLRHLEELSLLIQAYLEDLLDEQEHAQRQRNLLLSANEELAELVLRLQSYETSKKRRKLCSNKLRTSTEISSLSAQLEENELNEQKTTI